VRGRRGGERRGNVEGPGKWSAPGSALALGGQIERVQCVSISIVFATYVKSLVPELLSGAGKQAFVSSYIHSHGPTVWVSAQIAAVRLDTVRSRSGCSV